MLYKTLAFVFGLVVAFALTSCSDGALGVADETNSMSPKIEIQSGTLTTIYDESTGFEPSVHPIELRSNLLLQNGDDFKLSATSSKESSLATISLKGNQLQSVEGGRSATTTLRSDEMSLLSVLKKRSEELKKKVENLKPMTSQEWKKKLMSDKGAIVHELPNGNLEMKRSFVNKDGKTVEQELELDANSRSAISMKTYLDGHLVSESKMNNGRLDHSYHYDNKDSVRPQELAPWK